MFKPFISHTDIDKMQYTDMDLLAVRLTHFAFYEKLLMLILRRVGIPVLSFVVDSILLLRVHALYDQSRKGERMLVDNSSVMLYSL